MLTINKINIAKPIQFNTKTQNSQSVLFDSENIDSFQKKAIQEPTFAARGAKSAGKIVTQVSNELLNNIGLLDVFHSLRDFAEMEKYATKIFERPVEEFVGMDAARGLYNSGAMLAQCQGMKGITNKGEIKDPEKAATSLATLMELSKKMGKAIDVNKKDGNVTEYLFGKIRQNDDSRMQLFSILSRENNPEFMNLYANKLDEVASKYPRNW